MIEAFDFGSNWKHYSTQALTRRRVEGARQAFIVLTSGIELRSRSFLDVGFGQGLTALVQRTPAQPCIVWMSTLDVLKRWS